MLKPISKEREYVEVHGKRVIRRGWRTWLHWENLPWLEGVFTVFLKATGLWRRGWTNMLNVATDEVELTVGHLPKAFDGYRVLWLSDLHLEKLDGLTERVIDAIEALDYDVCFLGGDYCFDHEMSDVAAERMERIAAAILKRSAVYAIFGNHDFYRMGEVLDALGVRVLINEHTYLEHQGQRLAVIGVDDCHYYRADDLGGAMAGLEDGVCKILLCHSPERYKPAQRAGVDLFLAGHTHGGQVCLPNGFAPVTCASVPRAFIKGPWQHKSMAGHTSRGAGTSGVPVRFNCPGQIAVLTLRAATGHEVTGS